MEEKVNIAAILKDNPNGIRLYSPIFGDCEFFYVREDTNDICVKKHNGVKEFFDSKGLYYNTGEVMLFPSKEIRDWEKLSWKKGDLLINSCGFQCIFKEWESNDYTKFNGCYSNSRDGYEDVSNAETAKFVKLDNNTAYGYVRELEKRCGGKLNLETLKIEKPEFKDGDIITFKDRIIIIYNTSIEKSTKRTEIYYHACLKEGELTVNEYLMSCGFGEGWYSSTEEEKHNLFEAIAKKGKRWDSEKKQIVDLNPKVDELKPFDKVLVRDGKDDIWEPAFFFRYLSQFSRYNYQTVGGEWRFYCIPYIGNESLLGTTKDVEG